MTTTTETESDTAPAADKPLTEPCADEPLEARVEALLINADRPLTEARLGALLGIQAKGASAVVSQAIEALNTDYERSGRSFRAERLAGGWQLLTRAAFGPLLAQLHTDRKDSKLSQPALETLAIIAYRSGRGGIMRAEVEAIRGVACGEVLRGLLERRLVKVTGRSEELGRPMLYGVTAQFLKAFGLASLDDLPEVEGLRAEPIRQQSASAPTPAQEPQSSDETAEQTSEESSGADGA